MTIDPAPETDARPASGGNGDDATELDHHDGAVEAASPAPFDVEGDPGPDARAASEAETVEAAPVVAPTAVPTPVAPSEPDAAAPTPEPAPTRRLRRTRRIKARQVQRVVNRVDPWSMLKVSLLFALSMWLIVVVAGVLIWRVAVSTGTISNFENFLAQTLGEDTFTIDGSQIFQGSIVIGLVFFVTGAVFAVVTSVLFNLIAGLVGGVRFTMVELETARPVEEPADPA